jgi:hypothetical protein
MREREETIRNNRNGEEDKRKGISRKHNENNQKKRQDKETKRQRFKNNE